MAVLGALERIPLIGLAGGFVEGYIPLVDDYFYCKSYCTKTADGQTRLLRLYEKTHNTAVYACCRNAAIHFTR
jgi:hypothetical protein